MEIPVTFLIFLNLKFFSKLYLHEKFLVRPFMWVRPPALENSKLRACVSV